MGIPSITSLTRLREKLTQEEMGAALGVTKQAVSQWENGISIPEAIFLVAVAMKCNGWRKDWAWACIEAHPRYVEYVCPECEPSDQPPAGVV